MSFDRGPVKPPVHSRCTAILSIPQLFSPTALQSLPPSITRFYFCHFRLILNILNADIYAVIQYVICGVWFLSLLITSLLFIHAVHVNRVTKEIEVPFSGFLISLVKEFKIEGKFGDNFVSEEVKNTGAGKL